MEKRLFSKLLPLMGEINHNFIDPDGVDCVTQIIDFIIKAVEERIDRMSQTEGEES